MSQSKISKIETGKAVPTAVDVERILRALDAPQSVIEEVTELAKLANTEFQDVRSLWRKGLEKKQHELVGLEKTSKVFRFFLPVMITGLLATPEYIRASLAHVPGDASKAIAKKLERQAILYNASKSFTFILTEAAVRWALCSPPEMAMQIDRLASLSLMANIRIGVIPLGTQSHMGPLNTFTVYDSSLATAENFNGALMMRDPRDVEFHLNLFALYEELAVFGDEARGHLSTWATAYRQGSLCEYGNNPGLSAQPTRSLGAWRENTLRS